MSNSWSGSPEQGSLALQSSAGLQAARGLPIAFLDRDGTINALAPDPVSGLPESPLRREDVRLLAGAASAVRELLDAGYAVVCVTNQPAAAKGKVELDGLLAVHERVCALLAEQGAELHASRVCLHHPEGTVAGLAGPCDCRKPSPGMLLDAADALGGQLIGSWILGDTDADAGAGRAAGSRIVLVENPESAHKRSPAAQADLIASDLSAGVAKLLAQRSP